MDNDTTENRFKMNDSQEGEGGGKDTLKERGWWKVFVHVYT